MIHPHCPQFRSEGSKIVLKPLQGSCKWRTHSEFIHLGVFRQNKSGNDDSGSLGLKPELGVSGILTCWMLGSMTVCFNLLFVGTQKIISLIFEFLNFISAGSVMNCWPMVGEVTTNETTWTRWVQVVSHCCQPSVRESNTTACRISAAIAVNPLQPAAFLQWKVSIRGLRTALPQDHCDILAWKLTLHV